MHESIFTIVGAFVAITSYILGSHMIVFFYIGIAFFAYGIVRWVVVRPLKKDKAVSQTKMAQSAMYCWHCGSVMHNHQKFCTRCGAKRYG